MLNRFPSLNQVKQADGRQIARWFRFLPTPRITRQERVMERIAKRFLASRGRKAVWESRGDSIPGFYIDCT
jgi:hypothetical protein